MYLLKYEEVKFMYTTEELQILKGVLYDKSCTCPLCNHAFTTKTIKVGKNQVTSIDEDLYPHYSLVNPLLYDVITCPTCGYSALTKSFTSLLPKQKEWLSAHFHKGAKSPSYGEYTTIDEAINKHKIALVACMTRKSKLGEQAYLALHIAWLYRDKGSTEEELSFIRRAYEGFSEALTKETFPILGLDEATVMYMLAAMAHQLDKLDECKQYLSAIITMHGLSPRLKTHATNLKNKIFEKK